MLYECKVFSVKDINYFYTIRTLFSIATFVICAFFHKLPRVIRLVKSVALGCMPHQFDSDDQVYNHANKDQE